MPTDGRSVTGAELLASVWQMECWAPSEPPSRLEFILAARTTLADQLNLLQFIIRSCRWFSDTVFYCTYAYQPEQLAFLRRHRAAFMIPRLLDGVSATVKGEVELWN